jgi:hypothetical protein
MRASGGDEADARRQSEGWSKQANQQKVEIVGERERIKAGRAATLRGLRHGRAALEAGGALACGSPRFAVQKRRNG